MNILIDGVDRPLHGGHLVDSRDADIHIEKMSPRLHLPLCLLPRRDGLTILYLLGENLPPRGINPLSYDYRGVTATEDNIPSPAGESRIQDLTPVAPVCRFVTPETVTHTLDMFRCGAATPADHPDAGIDKGRDVEGHLLRCGGEDGLITLEVGDAGIGLRNEREGRHFPHCPHRLEYPFDTQTAIRPETIDAKPLSHDGKDLR